MAWATNCRPNQPLEVWATKAGMDWSIRETPVCYRTNGIDQDHGVLTFQEQKVLYRSDNGTALSVVGDRYNVVQPRDVLEFYRDLTASFGYGQLMQQLIEFTALCRASRYRRNRTYPQALIEKEASFLDCVSEKSAQQPVLRLRSRVLVVKLGAIGGNKPAELNLLVNLLGLTCEQPA